MAKILSLSIFLMFVFCRLYSQEERTVCGVLNDKAGEPLIGVNIYVKGTSKGVITDFDGKYCIQAPLGSILVYAFIGYSKTEVEVTYKNSKPVSIATSQIENPKEKSTYTPIIPFENADTDTIIYHEGMAGFTPQTPSFIVTNPNYNWLNAAMADPSKVKNINFENNIVVLSLVKEKFIRIPHITFDASYYTEDQNKLPKIQNIYAQGRPVNGLSQWRGPDAGEILSWGPAIENLEYDGLGYAFDKNGRLVTKGLGSDIKAKSYNPNDLFRIGRSFYGNLKIHGKDERKEFAISLSHKYSKGIIPNSTKKGYYIDAIYKRFLGNVTLKTGIIYDGNKNSLMSGVPSMGLIMSSVLTTPPTFDNTNGLPVKEAVTNSEAYLLANGLQRSFAPGLANNPYWLVNNLRDKDTYYMTGASIGMEVKFLQDFTANIDGNVQNQEYSNSFAFPENTAGIQNTRELDRTDNLTSLSLSSGIKYKKEFYKLTINSQLSWNFKYTHRSLNRHDYFKDPDSTSVFQNSPFLRQNSISWTNNFVFHNWLLWNISQNVAHSALYNNKTFYAPSFSGAINLHELIRFNYDIISFFKIRSSWGINYTDIPLAYTFGYFDYLNLSSANLSQSFFNYETTANFSLSPEKTIKKGLGTNIQMINNRLTIDFDIYENKTNQGIFPVMGLTFPELKNLADYRTRGIDAGLDFNAIRYHRGFNANFKIVFTKYNSKVTHMYNNSKEIPLAGFSDIHTSLIEGQPKGVLVGTTYKRNENGEMIIGPDGYPLVDDKLHVIGNPNPDFILSVEQNYRYKDWSLGILLEFRKGGDVWNGTGNTLKYLGLAESTVNDRKITEYIFPGVTADGTPNSMPVDFANHINPIEANRWYRYGYTGVGEDGIEDASWFRIKEINISYRLKNRDIVYSFSLFFRNPLLITKYSGVDPESTLWGKANTAGIDLFNSPSTSSVGFNIKINL